MLPEPDAPSVPRPDLRASVGEAVGRVFAAGDATLDETLRRLAVVVNETISGSDMVAVSTLLAGRPRAAGFSDAVAFEVDDLRRRSNIGACPDGTRRQRTAWYDVAEKDTRWPPFNRTAATRGILSSLSVPLVAHHRSIGELHCYSRTASAFSPDDERIASAFADATADALVSWEARHRGEHFGRTGGPGPQPDRDAGRRELDRLGSLLFNSDDHVRTDLTAKRADELLGALTGSYERQTANRAQSADIVAPLPPPGPTARSAPPRR